MSIGRVSVSADEPDAAGAMALPMTSQALCGRVGGKIRSEYAMVGDVINLAARLMGKAKGRILCDEVTKDLVSGVDARRSVRPSRHGPLDATFPAG